MVVGKKKARDICRTSSQLLPVLLAEIGAICGRNLKELEDHSEDAFEMPGPRGAFETRRKIQLSHPEPVLVGIETLGRRQEDEFGLFGLERA